MLLKNSEGKKYHYEKSTNVYYFMIPLDIGIQTHHRG